MLPRKNFKPKFSEVARNALNTVNAGGGANPTPSAVPLGVKL